MKRWFDMGDAVLFGTLGLVLLILSLVRTNRANHELSEATRTLDACTTKLSRSDDRLAAAVKTQELDDERRFLKADWVLWEVHELETPVKESELESWCTKVGLHANAWTGTELMGYSVFTNPRGKDVLTCRWIRPGTP